MRDARGISSGGCWNLSRRSLWNLCGSCFGYLLGSFGIKLPLESPKGAPGNLPRVDPGISPSVLLKTRHNVCSKFDRSCSWSIFWNLSKRCSRNHCRRCSRCCSWNLYRRCTWKLFWRLLLEICGVPPEISPKVAPKISPGRTSGIYPGEAVGISSGFAPGKFKVPLSGGISGITQGVAPGIFVIVASKTSRGCSWNAFKSGSWNLQVFYSKLDRMFARNSSELISQIRQNFY